MSEEEIIKNIKEQIQWSDHNTYKMALQGLLDLYTKQQKEINFYKNEELGYIAGYEDGKRHKQTAVMIKKENAQQELFEKEIEKLKFENHMLKKWNEQLDQECISKDKIREKIKNFEEIRDIIAVKENIDLNYDMKRNDYCVKMLNELLEEK